MRYFEDFPEGSTFEVGTIEVTEAEVVEFGRRFDPQPFHVDAEAAARSPFGGLIASGWHTAALTMRVMVDGLFADAAGLGSPGIDELRWSRPVRPGDTLAVRITIVEARPSRSRPDRGLLRMQTEVRNQAGEPVMTFVGMGLMRRRPADTAD